LFLDPDKFADVPPADILEAAAQGHIGLDHRFLRALIDRRDQALSAAVAFAERDRTRDRVNLEPELISLFHYWRAPQGIPFLLNAIREDPKDVPDDVVETLAEIGPPALDPLLSLHAELKPDEREEVEFILANLRVRDERIEKIFAGRAADEDDFLVGIYNAEKTLDDEPFDIWDLYPEKANLPTSSLDEDERMELLSHPVESVRASAAGSFFNAGLSPDVRRRLLAVATQDSSAEVRARAWEALITATDSTEVIDAMLAALRRPDLSIEERGGLLVGLAPEADRKEIREAIVELYDRSEGRAKALEAMWRSLHPSFRDYFSKNLNDADLEVRRGALWGVGYYGIKSELDHLRRLFDDEELRTDALFAYALALPGDTSRGRVKGLLTRIETDAQGLTEVEEELVKVALDERLMLAGKEPYFRMQDD